MLRVLPAKKYWHVDLYISLLLLGLVGVCPPESWIYKKCA